MTDTEWAQYYDVSLINSSIYVQYYGHVSAAQKFYNAAEWMKSEA